MLNLNDLRQCWHRCPGSDHRQALLFTLTVNGYVEWPVFFLSNKRSPTGRIVVTHCPTCGTRLNLNDCIQLAQLPCNGC